MYIEKYKGLSFFSFIRGSANIHRPQKQHLDPRFLLWKAYFVHGYGTNENDPILKNSYMTTSE
jgi:hypothetical protein